MASNLRLLPFSRFIVKEESMLPAYKQGDHVLTFNWIKLKIGDVVVFKYEKKNYIKRIVRILGDSAQVEGDNKNWSSKISPITLRQIVGKVILKY